MKINIKNIRLKSICATLFISLFLACNNGIEELEKRNTFLSSLANLGNDFLTIFTSFGDSLGGVLAFNAETKKSDVGKYFKNIEKGLTTTKTNLEKIVADMKDQGHPNATAVESAVSKLVNDTLNNIINGAKTVSDAIGITDAELLGNGAIYTSAAGSKGEVEKLVNGIKAIVDVVLDTKEGNPEAGDVKKATDGSGNRNGGNNQDGEAGKLFNGTNAGTNANAKKSAADAAKAVGAVTGADILKAMSKSDDSAKLAAGNDVSDAKQDAVIAGAMALRAMAKGGKFAGSSDNDSGAVAPIVKGAAVSAVNKALNTLTIAIRKTIDAGLKEVKKAMNINANDVSVTTESGTATK
ncbi:variable large family protein (plasmid) [Borrelia coriaceae]|nr:variable large family protein [Borrelia coriaceae]UPA17117.1 variable large family protein [Borrelia coriaceae]UPA17228.1 variable large family protein [Borrelia coriaceae]